MSTPATGAARWVGPIVIGILLVVLALLDLVVSNHGGHDKRSGTTQAPFTTTTAVTTPAERPPHKT